MSEVLFKVMSSNQKSARNQCDIFWDPKNMLGYGNGNCDLFLNTVENFFDAGDCCLPGSEEFCIHSNLLCYVETLGDGICQDYNNGPLSDYDLGDCCVISQQTECCFCRCPSDEITGITPATLG